MVYKLKTDAETRAHVQLLMNFKGMRTENIFNKVNSSRSSLYPIVKGTVSRYSANAPNFDFWTGCPEIKRCGESKRTLKNPFASRLAEFSTTLNLLRITDQ